MCARCALKQFYANDLVYVCYTPQKYPFKNCVLTSQLSSSQSCGSPVFCSLSSQHPPPRSQIFNCHSYFIFGCSLVICVLGDEGLCFCSVSLCWTPLVCIQQYLVLCGRGEICNFAERSFQKTRKRSFNCTVYFNGLLLFFFSFFFPAERWASFSEETYGFFFFDKCVASKIISSAFSPILKHKYFHTTIKLAVNSYLLYFSLSL